MKPPSSYIVHQVISEALAALITLETEDGLILDTPEAILKALTQEVEPDVNKILVNLARAALDAEACEKAIDERIAAMRARKQRFAQQRSTYRYHLTQSLLKLGLRDYPDAEFVLSVHEGERKVHVLVPAAELPAAYQRKVEIEADKIALRKVLKGDDQQAKDELLGKVVLGNTEPQLTIRVR